MELYSSTNQDLSKVQEEIRKEKLSTYNRLHSIAEDAAWVESISHDFSQFPIAANQRCGAWYVNPDIAAQEWVYFKSTDGHFGRWEFNLRRANLHLLPLIDSAGGLLIVDSTRRGKRIPDALSKTIPIWCTVINRALQTLGEISNWDTSFHVPPKAVSHSEQSQIEERLDSWAAALVASSFKLHPLRRPLRPFFVFPGSSLPALDLKELPFLPIICVSASKCIDDNSGGIERRSGYTYVQGSGDDHELWSQRLDPALFWQHRDRLLRASPSDLDRVIMELVQAARNESPNARTIIPRLTLDRFPIEKVQGQLILAIGRGTSSELLHNLTSASDYLIALDISTSDVADLRGSISTPSNSTAPSVAPSLRPKFLCLNVKPASGSAKSSEANVLFLDDILPRAVAFTQRVFVRNPRGVLPTLTIAANDNGSNLGTDQLVGIMVGVLQVCFDDEGTARIQIADEDGKRARFHASKKSLRLRLQWVQSSFSKANPSRSTLKRVNEFFMAPRGKLPNVETRRGLMEEEK